MWASVPSDKTAQNTVHVVRAQQSGETIFYYRPDEDAYSTDKKAKRASAIAVAAFEKAVIESGSPFHSQYIKEWHGREISPEHGVVIGATAWERQASLVSKDFSCLVYIPTQVAEILRKKEEEETIQKRTLRGDVRTSKRKPKVEVATGNGAH